MSVVAAVEFLLYWWLVFHWPLQMLPLSTALSLFSYLMHLGVWPSKLVRAYIIKPRDQQRLQGYLRAWTFIAFYGALFATFLLLR